MGWIIAFIISVICLSCFVTFKVGEFHELHNVRAAFERYEDAHKEVKRSKEIDEVVKELEDELNIIL